MLTPPWSAATWPSSEVPVPKGMTGVRCAAHILTMLATSSPDTGNATASGGYGLWKDSSRPCAARTSGAIDKRSPNSAHSSSVVASQDVAIWDMFHTCKPYC